jgi:hypothetical protein
MTELASIDWEQMSQFGLIYEINKKVLHPLGLAMTRNPENGFSEYVLIADDLEFEYNEYTAKTNEERLQEFLSNRVKILNDIISEQRNQRNQKENNE